MTTCQHRTAGSPIEVLRAEHEVILRALGLLDLIATRLERNQPVNPDGLPRLGEFFRTFVDRCHHTKEERYLFPLLEQHGVPREGGPLGVMLQEHEHGRAYVGEISSARAPGDGRLAGLLREYAALLRAHIEKENQVLFRMADQVLPDEAMRELSQCFETMEHDEIGVGAHERLLSELEQLERRLLADERGGPA